MRNRAARTPVQEEGPEVVVRGSRPGEAGTPVQGEGPEAVVRGSRPGEAGMTMLEVMIASAVMVIMMALAWRTISNTSDSRRAFGKYQERNHEIRMALNRVVADFEAAYLSRNEDQNASHPRTMMIAKPGSRVPQIRFSTLGHRVLWADANESEQTVIAYTALASRDRNAASGQVDWIRSERRRPSNRPPEDEPAEYDVLVRDITKVELEFWNWRNLEWQDTWDTTQSDGQRGQLPSRVRITITVKNLEGRDVKVSSQARIMMQEPLNFSPS
jgi:type II secretory pathway component PulJ